MGADAEIRDRARVYYIIQMRCHQILMGLEAAVVLAAVAVATGTDFAVAGSGPHRCGGTPLVQGNPTHGWSYSRRSSQGRVLRVAVACHRGEHTPAQASL